MLNERNTLLEDDGIEEEILVEEECSVAQAVWGDIQGNIENQTDLKNALDAKQDNLTEAQLNAVNSGITNEKVTTYDGYADQIASKADQSALNAESVARGEADMALGTRIDNEALARQQTDNGLQSQIDAITSKSDVVDVVANYAALQAYDTSTLGNNDVVKVLDDETHEDALTYYRWSTTTQTWSYIGQEAPYYSKGQMDVKLAEKQDKLTAGANIQIQNGTISATDTTYTAGNGINLNGTEFSADTTVLATKEDLEVYYTKPETDNLLAPKLEAEVVAELPTTGAEGKLYLTPKAHTTSTATGNPIEATITAQAGQLESFQLDGDTFQQSYTGKNLFNKNDTGILDDVRVSTSDGKTYGSPGSHVSYFIKVKPSTAYALTTGRTAYYAWYSAPSEDSYISGSGWGDNYYFTSPAVAQYIRFDFTDGNIVQFVEGTSAGDYEPYVGGQPSPNPDYPQAIQTVTGVQTVSINGTDYPLDLGNIELNGLGDDGNGNPLYKDRIYKDGEDWKVHKATKKVKLEDVAEWFGYAKGSLYVHYFVDSFAAGGSSTDNPIVSSDFHAKFLIEENSCFLGSNNYRVCFCPLATLNWADYISDKHPVVYYALATPTDTTITDTTLIAQLEAIRTAALENGTNTITNTTGSNLAGDMEIGYYGFNPTNRYDKFIWLDINNNYEQIGGE